MRPRLKPPQEPWRAGRAGVSPTGSTGDGRMISTVELYEAEVHVAYDTRALPRPFLVSEMNIFLV